MNLYRRHLAECAHRSKGRAYSRCKCPVWVEGTCGGRFVRESLKLRDWQRASAKVREWEARGYIVEEATAEPTTIVQACASFLRDGRARKLKHVTLKKYCVMFRHLRAFAEQRGMRFISECGDLATVRAFRQSWPDANLSALKKLERLRAFLGFCVLSGWLETNPAKLLKNPKVTQPPTLPFSREEVSRIVTACAEYPDKRAGMRLRALVLLLRFSGLRIRDAVTLGKDRVQKGRLFLYTAKTGTPVWVPLPPSVTDALAAIEGNGRHWFWSGESNPKSCVGNWQRSLRLLFKLSGVQGGHAHRFRDTCAVELLLAGVPLERVAVILGHQSVKVTEKHYSPWIAARQEQLEQDIRRTWDAELLANSISGSVHPTYTSEKRKVM
jgi:integrase/recombinase XerD